MDQTELALKFNADLQGKELNWLLARGLTTATISKALLGYVAEGRYAHSISIPYLNPGQPSTVRSIRFRYLRPGRQKYDNLKGQKIHLYNVGDTAKSKVWLCEGEFDALVLKQMGFAAVGIPGASGFKPDWKYLFTNADLVSIVMDGDEAGEQGGKRLASILGDVVNDLRMIRLPEGMDVTDCYLRDADELKELVS